MDCELMGLHCFRISGFNKVTFNSAWWVILHAFLAPADFYFSKLTFSNNSLRNTIRVSNSLVGPDLGPNCLQKVICERVQRVWILRNGCIKFRHLDIRK